METLNEVELSTETTIEVHHMAGLLAFYENRYDDALVRTRYRDQPGRSSGRRG